jgi:alpha-L-fucosidase
MNQKGMRRCPQRALPKIACSRLRRARPACDLPQVMVAGLCALWLGVSTTAAVPPPQPLDPLPSASQLAWHDDDLTVFVHFGMNTFTGRSTGLGDEDPNLFDPTRLDCRQWVRAAKECGFKGFILTAKHHDGFCLWPTKTTRHSVASSRWRDGRGDVVRELSEACREAGLRFGIYCSPWDRSTPLYTNDPPAYARMYREQLTELLSNYGPVYEMWFDGNRANVADWPNVVRVVRTLQPNAIIKQGPRLEPIREDVRWVGNERAGAPLANWDVYPPPGSANGEDVKRIWFPVECDTPMIGDWFWADTLPLDLSILLDYYYTSVGRGSILLLNIAPNREGLFSKESVARLHEFHDALSQTFGTDFAAGQKARASNVRGNDPGFGADRALDGDKNTYWATDDGVSRAWLEVDLGAPKEFNVIRLEEAIRLGQRVAEYKLEVWDNAHNDWKEVNHGFTIGHRKLDRFPKVKSSKVRLTILKGRAGPTLSALGVHLDSVTPPEQFEPSFANAEVARGSRMPKQTPLPNAPKSN